MVVVLFNCIYCKYIVGESYIYSIQINNYDNYQRDLKIIGFASETFQLVHIEMCDKHLNYIGIAFYQFVNNT